MNALSGHPPAIDQGHNPSRWSRRLLVAAFALGGLGIASYLTLYQLGVVAHVWEPFFGFGSKVILKESSISHLLPVPDAALGAVMYLLELVAALLGGEDRWRTRPGVVLFGGLVAAGLALAGITLAVCQPLLFHAFCTLCLCSVACSIVLAALAAEEVIAALRRLRHSAA